MSWAEAFAAQAQSDLIAYEVFCERALAMCHRLHYLQMWLEKLCKAYLWSPLSGNDDLRFKHNVVEKVLPQLVREHWRRIGFDARPDLRAIRDICREIDLLHPQVDDNKRRLDNVEYPWMTPSGDVVAPAGERFRIADRLHRPAGRLLLKAAIRLTRNPAIFVPPQNA